MLFGQIPSRSTVADELRMLMGTYDDSGESECDDRMDSPDCHRSRQNRKIHKNKRDRKQCTLRSVDKMSARNKRIGKKRRKDCGGGSGHCGGRERKRRRLGRKDRDSVTKRTKSKRSGRRKRHRVEVEQTVHSDFESGASRSGSDDLQPSDIGIENEQMLEDESQRTRDAEALLNDLLKEGSGCFDVNEDDDSSS